MPYIICDGKNYYCQNEGSSLTVKDVNETTKKEAEHKGLAKW